MNLISLKNNNFLFLIIVSSFLLLLSTVHGWHEASRCTTGSGSDEQIIENNFDESSSQQSLSSSSDSSNKILSLNCDKNLIFIAWSHYGHQFGPRMDLRRTANQSLNSKAEYDEACYFAPSDCVVNVDYVANECNGLSACQISLDAQYLHSCKAYSDYLFIIYDCIEAESTVNICDSSVDIQTSVNAMNQKNKLIYIQTPNYPNEYFNNLDCNCSLKTVKGSSIQIELLEFDLESASDNSILSGMLSGNIDPNSINSYNPSGLIGGTSSEMDQSTFDFSQQQSSLQTCSKDYLSIGGQNSQSCGTLSSFNNLISDRKRSFSSFLTPTHQIINLRFYSDDSLTRRGFWLKVKPTTLKSHECPENFILVDKICLKIFNEQLTWYEAQTYCNNLGYSLATIDNFELDRQLNKFIFNTDEPILTTNNQQQQQQQQSKRFWMGIRHLNRTNWFDYKNEVIRFRTDEQNWWPWLIVDSATYNKGSCVGKKRNSFFLEDCYKRMPFACEYKPPAVRTSNKDSRKSNNDEKIHFKCGKNAEKYFITETTTKPTTTTTTTTTKKKTFTKTSSSLSSNRIEIVAYQSPASYDLNPLETTRTSIGHQSLVDLNANKNIEALNEFNLPFSIRKDLNAKNNQQSDSSTSTSTSSTILIALICGITILIALINSFVVVVLCRRKRYFMKKSSASESKTPSHDSMTSSSHNLNLDDPCLGNGGINSTSTLTFSGSGSTGSHSINSNSHLPLFLQQQHHQQPPTMMMINDGGAITINPRRTGFFTTNNNNNNNTSNRLMINSSFIPNGMTLKVASQLNKQHSSNGATNNQNNSAADQLAHIYETISLSSASNSNFVTMGLDGILRSNVNNNSQNPYNIFNHYHLHQNVIDGSAGGVNEYNEVECSTNIDSHLQNQFTNNNNQHQRQLQQQQPIIMMQNLSPNDSSTSHRSRDFFLLNNNSSSCSSSNDHHQSENNKNKRSRSKSKNNNKMLELQNQQPLIDSSSSRFSDLNLSTNTSSPSSTATTMTELGIGVVNGGHQTPSPQQQALFLHQYPHQFNSLLFNNNANIAAAAAAAAVARSMQTTATTTANRTSQRNLLSTLTNTFNQYHANQHQQQDQQTENNSSNLFANRIEAVV